MNDAESDALAERAAQELDDRLAIRRFEARQYGFSREEAEAFARSSTDIGQLRKLVKQECPVELAVRILDERPWTVLEISSDP